MEVTLSASTLEQLIPDFPVQTAILLSRMLPQEAEPTLLRLYQNDIAGAPMDMQRIAAAMLALHPPAGFAASILSGTTVNVLLFVTSPEQPGSGFGMSGGSCIGIENPPFPKDWPEINDYRPHVGLSNLPRGSLLLATGIDPVYATRIVSTTKGDSYWQSPCGSSFYGLSNEVRSHLIAQMLDVQPADLDWTTEVQETSIFENVAAYNKKLVDLTASYLDHFHATAIAMRQKGLLTPDEAAILPQLRVRVDDRRQDKSIALPIPTSTDQRITYERFCLPVLECE